MKKHVNMIAGALAVLTILIFIACSQPTNGSTEKISATPTAAVTSVAKTAATQKAVTFTLTSTNSGMWKVYSAQTGGTALLTVTVKFTAPDLTLSSTGSDLAAATYYASVTENGKTESARLALTVQDYVAPDQSATPTAAVTSVTKTAATQKDIVFALTSSNTGTWKVYSAAAGGSALTDVTAAFAAPNLTLSSTGDDLAAATYYVSVTETGKTESARLALTVSPQAVSGTPTATVTSVAKTTDTQKSVVFALTSTNTGTWKVYSAMSGGTALTDVAAAFAAPNLTLSSTGSDLATGAYYVSVTETDKAESGRLALSVIAAGQSHAPEFVSTVFTKTQANQSAATFTLTAAHTGATWAVYATDTATTVHPDVTVAASGTTLTITAKSGGIAGGTYYVTVRDAGDQIDSLRTALTVEGYSGAAITVTFGSIPNDTVTVTGVPASVTKEDTLNVDISNSSSFTSFAWILNGTAIASATGSSYSLAVSTLTLGLQRLTVIAYKDTVPFSTELVFTVTE